MNHLVVLIAMALSVASVVSAQNSIKLRLHGAPRDFNHTSRLDRETKRVAAKYAMHAKMYFQNNGKHLSVVNGTTLSKRANSGELELDMLDAATWVGDIEIGSPGQKQTVIFDSGSPNIVLGRESYKPDESSTSKDLHKSFHVSYLGPEAEGSVYTDDVVVAGVKAKHVAIGKTGSNFLNADPHKDLVGLFGLTYPQIGSFDVPDKNTFVGASKRQKLFYDDVFQFVLRRNGDSYLNVGKIDMDKVDGDIGWVSVDKSHGFWKTDVEINGHKSNGIIDSGTTFILGSNDDVKKILDDIDGVDVKKSASGDWQAWYKCGDPPKVQLKIAGKEVTMSEGAMIAGIDGDQCQLGIAGVHGTNSWIFGSSFFQMFTVIFDFDNERMGFGKQK